MTACAIMVALIIDSLVTCLRPSSESIVSDVTRPTLVMPSAMITSIKL